MNKKTKGVCLFLLCFALFASGCGTTASATVPTSSLETETTTTPTAPPTETAPSGEQDVNIIYDAPLAYVLDYPTFENPAINAEVEQFIAQRKEAFASTYTTTHPKKSTLTQKDCTSFLYISYESYVLDDSLLSVALFETQEDTLTNTSVENTFTLHFLAETGERVLETDLIQDGFYQKVSNYCIKYFTTTEPYKTRIYGDYATTLTPDSGVFDTFSLTNDGVVLYFEPYVLFPKSVGRVSITIPYEELLGTLSFLEQEPVTEPEEETEAPSTTLQQPEIRQLDPNKPMVALTFDDGPNVTHTNRILDALEENNAVATFFDLGRLAEAYPEVVQRELALGCEVGSHSYSHKNFDTLSAKAIAEDFAQTATAFERAIGIVPTLFRPPYGNANDFVKSQVPMALVTWSVDTLDWKSKNPTAIMDIVKNEGSLDGKVILMHGIYETSAEATEILVPYLLENGYQLVTISELLHYKHDATPEAGKLYGYYYFR